MYSKRGRKIEVRKARSVRSLRDVSPRGSALSCRGISEAVDDERPGDAAVRGATDLIQYVAFCSRTISAIGGQSRWPRKPNDERRPYMTSISNTTRALAGKPHAEAPEDLRRRHLSALKAIRLHCVACNGGSPRETTLCPMPECHLFPFRFGQMPNTARAHGRLVDPELFVSDSAAGGKDAAV